MERDGMFYQTTDWLSLLTGRTSKDKYGNHNITSCYVVTGDGLLEEFGFVHYRYCIYAIYRLHRCSSLAATAYHAAQTTEKVYFW
jgi:hypothetical protein